MPDQGSDPFSSGGTFCANPHLYDYIHRLDFDPSGTVEMVEGVGQVINTLVNAQYSVQVVDAATFRVNFTDVVELDPYYDLKRFRHGEGREFMNALQQEVPYEESDVRSRPEPFSVVVTQEEGIFPIRLQVVWKVNDEGDWPYELYRVRYRFSSDPLEQFRANRQGNLYFQVEAPEPDTRVCYRAQDLQERTARDLAQEGITFEDERS